MLYQYVIKKKRKLNTDVDEDIFLATKLLCFQTIIFCGRFLLHISTYVHIYHGVYCLEIVVAEKSDRLRVQNS